MNHKKIYMQILITMLETVGEKEDAPSNAIATRKSSWNVQPFGVSHATAPTKVWGAQTAVNVKHGHVHSISVHDFPPSARSHPTGLSKPLRDVGGWIFQRWV